ncbi:MULTISPECIES: alkaline phosphatase D family protein [Hyphomonas]|uniref:alkaline phosphatase D family protein n=1 Tax=Hyphomonas TaxID=85 RepID=UPI003002FCA4
MSDLTRRHSMALIAAATLAGCATDTQPAGPSVFQHGVASGDPTSRSVVLWTRVTTPEDARPVTWQLAEDRAFRSVIASGRAVAQKSADHTVKIVPQGLEPGRTYYYRFLAGPETSPIGRTRTLAVENLDRLVLALVSCSNYGFGYFNVYDAIARDPAIDFVLHTGDYIYEYGNPELERSPLRVRAMEPAHETVSLEDFRLRHAQSKTDSSSQAMHAAHTLLACWDDHEVANDSWLGGAQNHQPESEGRWADRRDAAVQAYYEWMPVREPAGDLSRAQFWRTYRFGNLATMVTLETRHTAKAHQVDYAAYKDMLVGPEDRDTFLRDVLGAPGREMISEEMKADLRDSLASSVARGEPWRLIGNPGLLVRENLPDLEHAGIRVEDHPELTIFDTYTDIVWKSRWGLPASTDAWGGYPAARQEFYEICQSAGARDLVVLTGDSHAFWANQLADDKGIAMGVELGTAGITSPSDYMLGSLPVDLARKLDALTTDANPEVRWTDSLHRGYVKVDVTAAAARADFIIVDTVTSESYKTSVLRREQLVRTGDTIGFA